jgi:hypothetical protein
LKEQKSRQLSINNDILEKEFGTRYCWRSVAGGLMRSVIFPEGRRLSDPVVLYSYITIDPWNEGPRL